MELTTEQIEILAEWIATKTARGYGMFTETTRELIRAGWRKARTEDFEA